MNNFPLISIIVPVYNAEKSLKLCIDSILLQTYKNFELLLIDDGSSDLSGTICDEYVVKDSRVYVFHKKNGGVSSARNIGLDNATGEWVTFCDSDDYFSKECLENLLSYAKNGVDLVFSYATIVFRDGSIKKEVFPSKKIFINEIESAFIDNELHIHSSPWGKLYRKSLIDRNKLRFCETMYIGEDAVFLFSYISNCRCIYISSNTDYFYNFENENSLTKRVNSIESEINGYNKIVNVIKLLCDKCNIKNNIALCKLDWIKGYYIRRILNAMYYNKVNRKERLHIMRSLDLTPYWKELHISAIKEKIFVLLLKRRLYNFYDVIRILVMYYHRLNKM